MRALHEANNLPYDNAALARPEEIACYFARMSDSQTRRLTAVRRATQFKGVVKSRLIRVVTNALQLIDAPVFKLDNDFDLLIDSTTIHVLRPSGFEFLEKLQSAILAAVPANARSIQRDLPFVEFAPIAAYARKHTRAARYLASIHTSNGAKHINKRALKELCKRTGVEIQERRGQLSVKPGYEMGFLEVLDRRRYQIELIEDTPERFRATGREKI